MNNNNLNIITYNIEKLSDTSKSIDFQQHIDDNINIIGLTEYDITQNPSTSKQILDTFKSQSFFPIASTQNSRVKLFIHRRLQRHIISINHLQQRFHFPHNLHISDI